MASARFESGRVGGAPARPGARARPFTPLQQQPRPVRRRVQPSAAAPGKEALPAAAGAPAGRQQPGTSASGRLAARLLSWRSSAQPQAAEESRASSPEPQPAADEQQQAATSASAEQEARAAAAARSGAFSLYSWLTWGSSTATTSRSSGSSDDDATTIASTAELGDGMAAAEPGSLTGTGGGGGGGSTSSWRRRSWYSLSRSSRAGSFDDGEPPAPPAVVPVDHAALQLLRQRALSGSMPGARRDPFKLGLVVEGGGMRGCVSGGALQALNDLGLRNAFDAVYGSSAGAINATYFLSGQRTGVEIYHDHIANPEFINLKRLWRSGGGGDGEPVPVLNLSFLIDQVMQDVHPLDWEAVLDSPVPLKVVASSLDSLDAVLLSGFTDPADLAECLKASATVPEIAGGPRLHRGQRLVDAAVFEPVPFRSAIADGCTHILVLCTRPLLQRRSRVNSALADAMEVAIKKAVLSPDYMVPAWKAEVDYLLKDGVSQDEMLLAAARQPHDAHELPWFAGAHVYPLIPGAASNFSPLCIDVPTLKAGVAEGRRNVLALGRALLGDARDFSRFAELEASNIVPARGPASSSERLWRRYLEEDFSHHA